MQTCGHAWRWTTKDVPFCIWTSCGQALLLETFLLMKLQVSNERFSSVIISSRKKPLSSLEAIVWFSVSDCFMLWSQSFEVNYTNWFQELIQGPKWHFRLKKELNRIIKSCFFSEKFKFSTQGSSLNFEWSTVILSRQALWYVKWTQVVTKFF